LGNIAIKEVIYIYTVQDAKQKVELYLPCVPRTIENWANIKKQRESLYGEKTTMIPEMPSRILNR
jgi:hypothetical protein